MARRYLFAVLYQALSPDHRRMAYAGMFSADGPNDALRMCAEAHGKRAGYQALAVEAMRR